MGARSGSRAKQHACVLNTNILAPPLGSADGGIAGAVKRSCATNSKRGELPCRSAIRTTIFRFEVLNMKARDIIEQAKMRLAEIEEEAAVLRRMIAAAEKGTVQVTPAPAPHPNPDALPFPFAAPWLPPWPPEQPVPIVPRIVWPNHGGMCACPSCCPTVMLTNGHIVVSHGLQRDATLIVTDGAMVSS